MFLGDVEKNCAILLAFAEVDLTKVLPPFSEAEKDGQGVGGELLKAWDNRRGMAKLVSVRRKCRLQLFSDQKHGAGFFLGGYAQARRSV